MRSAPHRCLAVILSCGFCTLGLGQAASSAAGPVHTTPAGVSAGARAAIIKATPTIPSMRTSSGLTAMSVLRLPTGGGIPALGVSLEDAQWFASSDLPPDTPLDVIRTGTVATSSSVVLRSALPGGSGILFTLIDIPAAIPAGTEGRLTIADIDGNDETFFNGTPIGRTSGWGVTDFGQARIYRIPHEALKPGVNVLAIQITAYGRGQTFGIRRGPVTFALTPEAAPEPVADKRTTPPGVLSTTATLDLITASDPASSRSLLQRKRDSFGRFGEFWNNGLPAVSEVTPTRIATRSGPAFDMSLSGVKSVTVASQPGAPGIDGWHIKTRVQATVQDQPIIYTVHQNVLYPGAVVELEQGKVLPLQVRFPGEAGRMIRMDPAELRKLYGKSASGVTVYAFYPLAKKSTPAILAASGFSVNIIQAADRMDVSLARDPASKTPARLYLFFPVGLYQHDLETPWNRLTDLAVHIEPEKDPEQTIRKWLRIGLNEPVANDEYFQVMHDSDRVRIYQLARYRQCDGLNPGSPFAFRPPQVDFISQSLNYPTGDRPTSPTGILTFSGELYHSDPLNPLTSPTAPGEEMILSSYDLPIPPVNERAPVVPKGQKAIKELMHRFLSSDLGSSASITAVDALFKGRTQAYQAWSYLDPAGRKTLAENSLETIPLALGGRFWNESRERFSGLSYWWTYFLQGPAFLQYDQDWGNGLSLYGLATYAKYSGNRDLVRSHWADVERIFRWFTVSDDWEWMRASNSPAGHGTGAGDCTNATYAACIAYATLARATGRPAEHDYGLYMAARAALPALNRFGYEGFATTNDFKTRQSVVIGFHEGEGFLEGKLSGYPWYATSNISGNGIETQLFDLYMMYAQDALRNYELIFEKAFPHWMDGDFRYDIPTLYHDNSGYITLPHIYLRARLGGDSFASLADDAIHAVKNPRMWWLAPPVLGEMMTKKADGVVVTGWRNCAFDGGTVTDDPDDPGKKRLEVRFNNIRTTGTIEIALPKKPSRFKINGGPVPLTDSRYENGHLRLLLRRPGENVVTVVYSE